jgi:XRE family transcriptional regulator, regulator of sulfur utilization
MSNQYDFGALKRLRHNHKLTLHQLADACHLTYTTVAGIETNKASPSLRTIDALACYFDMSASQFLTLCEKPNLVQKTAERMRDPLDTQDILGLDKCKQVTFGDIRLIRAAAAAGNVIKAMPLHPDVFEVCYVLSGKTCVTCKSGENILGCNESVIFDGSQTHSYKQIEDGEFIVVYIPKLPQEISSPMPKNAEPQNTTNNKTTKARL